MDPIQFHHIKIEKSRGVSKFQAIRVFANLFRLIELLLLLVLVSKLFFRIPVAVKLSGDVFKDVAVFLASPRFVFVLGNAIVITLFAKSGQYSGQESCETTSTVDLYQEFLEKSEKKSGTASCEIKKREIQRLSAEKSSETTSTVDLYQEFLEKSEKKSETASCEIKKREVQRLSAEKKVCSDVYSYRRSKSEKLEAVKPANCVGKLKRCESDQYLRICDSDKKIVKYSCPEDCMSNEEFRNKIEAFIARQKRFQKDEEHLEI